MFGLNNKGWGLRQMIIYSTIIIVALLIATFYVVALYIQIDDNIAAVQNDDNNDNKEVLSDYETNRYLSYESELKVATSYMINTCNCTFDNIITYEQLIKGGYIGNFRDIRDNSVCDGYSTIYQNSSGEYIITPYIKCSNYQTEGYSK